MANIRAVREATARHGIRVYLDATRAMENLFIQELSPATPGKKVAEILREFCSYTSGATMSGKKDPLVNIGLALDETTRTSSRRPATSWSCSRGCTPTAAWPAATWKAMAIGIREALDDDYLKSRVGQVRYLGLLLQEWGIPFVKPVGGHGIFSDPRGGFPTSLEFPAQTLAARLYLESGVRSMERGIVSAGRDAVTGENHHPKLGLVRLTIPRRVTHPGAHGRRRRIRQGLLGRATASGACGWSSSRSTCGSSRRGSSHWAEVFRASQRPQHLVVEPPGEPRGPAQRYRPRPRAG